EGKKGWLSRGSVATLHKVTSTEKVVDLLNKAENKGPETRRQIIIF
ncbi:9972_t:CDS:1, partial [Rhizophagus irregularis]